MELKNTPNVLHIIDRWSTGGVRRVITNIAEKQFENGYNVSILSYFNEPGKISVGLKNNVQDNLPNVSLWPIGFKSSPIIKAIRNFYGVLNEFQPDIIHDHYGGVWSSLFLLSRSWKKRAVFHAHNELDVVPGSLDKRRVLRERLFRKYLLPRYSQVIAVSEPLKTQLIKNGSVQPHRFNVVHNSIDASRFVQDYSSDRNIIEEYGLAGKYKLLIGIVGRLVYEKGQDTVIDVLWHLRESGIEAAALLVGDGDSDYHIHLKYKLEDLNVAEHCYFAGHADNPADYYKAMDIFLFCSRQEPFGLTLLEAMACRTPIVAVKPERSGGPEEILKNGYNSILVNKREPGIVAEQVKHIYSDSELANTLIGGGEQTLEKYTNSLMYQSLLQVYNKIEQENKS